MPAEKRNRFERHALILVGVVLLIFATPLTPAQQTTSSVSTVPSAVVVATNQPTKNPLPGSPVPLHTKRKAGFLAGAGLAIISLLALAAGLALVRTFKR